MNVSACMRFAVRLAALCRALPGWFLFVLCCLPVVVAGFFFFYHRRFTLRALLLCGMLCLGVGVLAGARLTFGQAQATRAAGDMTRAYGLYASLPAAYRRAGDWAALCQAWLCAQDGRFGEAASVAVKLEDFAPAQSLLDTWGCRMAQARLWDGDLPGAAALCSRNRGMTAPARWDILLACAWDAQDKGELMHSASLCAALLSEGYALADVLRAARCCWFPQGREATHCPMPANAARLFSFRLTNGAGDDLRRGLPQPVCRLYSALRTGAYLRFAVLPAYPTLSGLWTAQDGSAAIFVPRPSGDYTLVRLWADGYRVQNIYLSAGYLTTRGGAAVCRPTPLSRGRLQLDFPAETLILQKTSEFLP
ncbi:MAG: hypothetical protein PHD32_00915 [Eubacteriales bacterium]|nr:hypothetical protein [Eubacteriales bacterium]